jgi:hypothetical protein
MAGTKIYWDTCIFLAWLKNEVRADGVMDGIEEIIRDVHNNDCILFTSVLMYSEILDSKMDAVAQKHLAAMFQRKNCRAIDVDLKVARMSSEIRSFYDRKGIKVATPDSIHLATAIIYSADTFQTLDGSGRKRNADILSLGKKSIAGHPLIVEVPMGQQLTMNAELRSSYVATSGKLVTPGPQKQLPPKST